jgi:putative drug exporter of the RND superfamily
MFATFGCFIYRYRLVVVATWAILVLVAVPIATRVLQVLGADGFSSSELEAARADAVLAQRFGFDPGTLLVVYEDPQGQLLATDPTFQADVETSVEGLRSLPEVADVISPAQNPQQIAPDGRAAYVVVALHLVPADPRPVLKTVENALRPTELRPTLTGQPVFFQDIFDVTESDLRRAELISFPFAAVALLFVFGSLAAASLPGLAAAAATTLTLAAMVGLSNVAELSIFSLNLATLLGLGLGIDYSLFIVSRFREELRHGKSVEEAIAGSISTAGRTVLVSGATVAAWLLGLLVFEFPTFRFAPRG